MAVMGIRWLDQLENMLAPYPMAYPAVVLAGLLLVAWLANFVTKRILLSGLRSMIERFSGPNHNAKQPLRVIARLSNIVPSVVLAAGLSIVPELPPGLVTGLKALCHAWTVLTIAMAVSHALDAFNDFYERRADARNKPIKGYLQVIKIVVFVFAGLSIVAILVGVELLHLVTGLGAATAVFMLIFQDTILSL
ncbi:MAG: mechanosensitive ion channel family protein, partial [Stenotrophomonas sp.]